MFTITFLAAVLSSPIINYTPVYPINSCEFFRTTSSTLASDTRIGGCSGTQFGCCGFPINEVTQKSPGSCVQQNCTACEHAVPCFEGSSPSVLNATETILEYVKSICHDIVGPSGKQCVAVTGFGIEAISYIEHGLNATAVCNAMGYCKSPNVTTRTHQTPPV